MVGIVRGLLCIEEFFDKLKAMSNFNLGKQFPPMPKPDDFGITDEHWRRSQWVADNSVFSGFWAGSKAKVDAYYTALNAWKQACREIPGDNPQ